MSLYILLKLETSSGLTDQIFLGEPTAQRNREQATLGEGNFAGYVGRSDGWNEAKLLKSKSTALNDRHYDKKMPEPPPKQLIDTKLFSIFLLLLILFYE